MRKLRLGRINWLDQILRASKWQSPDSHQGPAYLSMLCTSPCCLWTGVGVGAPRNLCQTLACLHSHPLLTLTLLHSVSQWDWPQAACNSTDICVNWLLIEFAIGWHWKEVGEGEEKNLGISLLPVHPWWWSTSITSVIQLQEGPVAPGSSRWPCQLLLLSFSIGVRLASWC